MKPDEIYARLQSAAVLPPAGRHAALLALHGEALAAYEQAVRKITTAQATQRVNTQGDPRTLAQIVGHIEAWDRFSTQGAGDILAGVSHPRAITDVTRYIHIDGTMRDFESVDGFNEWQAEIDQQRSWETIQSAALSAARTFYALFASADLLTAERLQQTNPHHRRMGNGVLIEDIPLGWVLWLLQLEHIAIAHVDELGMVYE